MVWEAGNLLGKQFSMPQSSATVVVEDRRPVIGNDGRGMGGTNCLVDIDIDTGANESKLVTLP